MENANFKYYEIDLSDIWDYERDEFIAGLTEAKFAQRTIDLIQLYVIKYAKPAFGKELDIIDDPNNYYRNINPNYYHRNVDEYIKADLRNKYLIEYFFHKYDCFQYCQSIVLQKDENDFNYFFSLKMRQYKDDLFEVENFFKYQLTEGAFKKDKSHFRTYIETQILQYHSLFSDNLLIKLENLLANSELFNNPTILRPISQEIVPSVWQYALFYAYIIESKEHQKLETLANTLNEAYKILAKKHGISPNTFEQYFNFYNDNKNRKNVSNTRKPETVIKDIEFVINNLLMNYPIAKSIAQIDLNSLQQIT